MGDSNCTYSLSPSALEGQRLIREGAHCPPASLQFGTEQGGVNTSDSVLGRPARLLTSAVPCGGNYHCRHQLWAVDIASTVALWGKLARSLILKGKSRGQCPTDDTVSLNRTERFEVNSYKPSVCSSKLKTELINFWQ